MKWFLKLCLCLPLLAQAQTLTVKVPSRPINDLDKEYQLKLLELALNHAGQPYKLERVDLNLNQYSLQQALAKGKVINVFWMGTSSALESSLIAIPIPLFRGLEGLRLSFIHADAQEKFNQINTLADLKQLKAAQGADSNAAAAVADSERSPATAGPPLPAPASAKAGRRRCRRRDRAGP